MKRNFSPDVEPIAKALLIERVASGWPVMRAIKSMGASWRTLQRWRKYDAAFAERLHAAMEEGGDSIYYTPECITSLKSHLIDTIANDARTCRDALGAAGVNYRTFMAWRRSDPDFEQAIRDAIEAMTERQADSLHDVHLEIEDPRAARVASENRRWLIEARNAKFRPRQPEGGGSAQLADIIRGALNRLIDDRKRNALPAPAQPVIDITPASPAAVADARRLQRMERNGPPSEGT